MKPETQSFYELAVQRAVERVRSSLDEALDMERLARGARARAASARFKSKSLRPLAFTFLRRRRQRSSFIS